MSFSSFRYLVKEGLKNARNNRMMSVASVFVLLSCMLLIGGAVLFGANIDSFLKYMESQNEIQVYMKPNATEAEQENVKKDLENIEGVSKVAVRSKDEGLDLLKESFGDRQIILEGLEGDENPLPVSYIVTLDNLDRLDAVIKTAEEYAGVDDVIASRNMAQVLVALRNTISMGGLVLVSLLVVVSLVITGNTIKLTVFNRRKEIGIMKLVGATDGFIRLPFIIEGTFLGLLSVMLAFGITWGYYTKFYNTFTTNPSSSLAFFAQNLVPFNVLGKKLFLGFLTGGLLTSGLGSFLFVRKHLKV